MISRLRQYAFLLAALLLVLFAGPPLGGQPPQRLRRDNPRLIVVVVIDQFRADYLVRFRDRFGSGGFNRLLRQGAVFSSCLYPYANTETAPGHATLATGTTPSRHGITQNTWYDLEQNKEVEAVEDASHPLVGAPGRISGVSPGNLVSSTLADELRLATEGKAKAFGVGLKDRSAVLSAGHTASGAYWYNTASGTFVTSQYYRPELPAWVVTFNQKRAAASYYGKDWKVGERVLLPLTAAGGQPDARFYAEFRYTPYGNDLVVDFAQELIRQEGLGADGVIDFLAVGFSSNDYVGHRWGPYSEEVEEMTARTDAQLAALLQFLDRVVGAGRYWLALSADHGVAPTLEQARARGLPAKNVDPEAAGKAINEAFAARWAPDDWLVRADGVFFNRETLRKHNVGVAQAAHLAGGVLLGIDGVLGYVAGEETRLDAALTEAVRLSTYRGRSPDVYIVLEPFALFRAERGGADHGAPHSYDTHVPLILLGPAFRPGVYPERVSPADLAPTLAATLGITPPALADGKILSQALRSPAAPARAAPATSR